MDNSSAIDIDAYMATMLVGFYRAGMHNNLGTMEMFSRSLPKKRSFLVVCGIERVLEYIKNIKFNEADIKTIQSIVAPQLISPWTEDDSNYLRSLNFAKSLKISAMRDGDVVFENEPILRVTGPIGMIQYIEKHICGIINSDMKTCSKAARIVIAAGNTPVIEMGGRRAHEEVSADNARACYIAGFKSTSSVSAYAKYGIPCSGTQGHIWIMSFARDVWSNRVSEFNAFAAWNKIYKDSTYLVDTYDNSSGVDNALRAAAGNIGAIRLDSGDLKELATDAKRAINKSEDACKVKIAATNDLNEYEIYKLKTGGAHIDVFGVGTHVVCSPDSPGMNFIYKLVSVEDGNGNWKNVSKLSADIKKGTIPCSKQIFRNFDPHSNIFTHDDLVKEGTPIPDHVESLLKERDVSAWNKDEHSIEAARALFATRRQQMPKYLKIIDKSIEHTYTVRVSEELSKAQQLIRQ